jgi:diguanylate cyclase (GGDEF)-like protein
MPFPALAAPANALQRRHLWALLAAGLAAVALGAMLGQGLAQSLTAALPAPWLGSIGAWVGAAVAVLLVPLSAWAAIRIIAPDLPQRAGLAAVTPLTTLGKTKLKSKPVGADAQAPARDALTGAYTQLHFVAAADREWSRVRRHGEDAALLMVDIDHFKRLNDEHGMPCGDAMLVEITRQSSSTLRPYDLLARFGGGVLVVYLPHTDLLGALDVAERIRERVTGLGLSWEGRRVKATVSVGVASVGAAHAALDAVIADAGGALREAKEAGRNCVRAAPIPPKRNQASARSAG